MTSKQLELITSDTPTSSVEASPAKTSAWREVAPVWLGNAPAFGAKCTGSFARLDHGTLLWKTSQLLLGGGSEPFSGTWPLSGTMHNGTASARHTSGRATPVLASLSLRGEMLPTPTACTYGSNQGGAAGRVGPVRYSLLPMAKRGMLPSPCARDHRSGKGWVDHGHTPQLPEVMGGLLHPEFVRSFMMGFPEGWLS